MRPHLTFSLCALCLLGASTVFAAKPSSDTASRCNFIIMMADDQGYQDLGCYGSPNIKTPNIDRLAKEGLRFTDFYSDYPVCSASRASLLTGSYQPRISMRGVLGPHTKVALHPDEITIADLVKAKGYATACVGKWHVGDTPETLPTAQGFDSYFGIPYSNDMARAKDYGNDADDLDRAWIERDKEFWRKYDNELYRDTTVIENPVDQTTLTDRCTAEADKFIRANKVKPFLLYFPHTMPHVPLFVPDNRYDPDPHTAYRSVIEQLDASAGTLMATLDELGLAENTLFIYTSDNGPWLSKKHHGGSALPLRDGKTTTWEGGMRVPCVMRWPKVIPAGGESDAVGGSIDFIATIADILGAALPEDRPIDGRTLLPILKDPTAPSPHLDDGYFYYQNGTAEAIRAGKWKLHVTRKTGLELYDLESDIGEADNLATTHPEVVQHLQKLLTAYDTDLKAHTRPRWQAADYVPPKPKQPKPKKNAKK